MSTSEETRGGTALSGAVPAGDPAPVALAEPDYAVWPQRVVAAILDDAILAGVTWLALGTGFAQPTLTPEFAPGDGWPSDPLVLLPIGAVVLLLASQGVTGWTPGKLVVGIRVVSERTSGPAGIWTTVVRWLLHVLDAFLLIGYLRPLWHPKRQTFADSIVRTVVVPALPDLPRRPRIVLYSAALVVVVLGLGYGCVPISGGGSSRVVGDATCGVDGAGSALTNGEIRPGGSVSMARERRMWTVRETLSAHPGATLSWTSEPSARDVEYRVELDARPVSGDAATVSRSWDIGTGESGSWSDSGMLRHARQISPDGDVHEAEVEVTESDSAIDDLGPDLFVDVRLIADGEIVAACGSSVSYGDTNGLEDKLAKL